MTQGLGAQPVKQNTKDDTVRAQHLRRTLRSTAVLAASTLVLPLALAAPVPGQEDDEPELQLERATYIVQLEQSPLATYDGGVPGIPGTMPDAGAKLDTDTAAADRYTTYLFGSQDDVLESVGLTDDDVLVRYDTTLNGFAATMDTAQAATLARTPGVRNVWEDEVRTADTVSTPDYLGLSGGGGVWETRFGGADEAGAGVVVGVIDSGIWPESPSFAELDGAEVPATWQGVCQAGTEEPVTCNNKLIGARYYVPPPDVPLLEQEFVSPRDYNGHGTHTAGTAAGNAGVAMEINGIEAGEGSGMAPAAHVAAYKAMWDNGQGASTGVTSMLVAAIDDAVRDGVDVINYSVSGSREFVVSPDEIAFLQAAAAGVFVATSAGNTGTTIGAGSVAHNAPWTTTVAAGTHDRNVNKTLVLGEDSTLDGVGVGPGVGPAPLVHAGDIAADGATQAQARECWPDIDTAAAGAQPAIDAALAEGAIVVCDRGTTGRLEKSAAVAQAGGVGMVLANVAAQESLNADFHSVPTIHVTSATGELVATYLADEDQPTAEISGPQSLPVVAPELASFSSYGPALAGSGDLLKPDILAPGVEVIAPVSPASGGEDFGSLSGTSMSTPHITGLAALMLQQHPGWSPMAVKSALMTTARQTNTADEPIQRGGADATPLDYGSGEVVADDAYDPGLVYDSGLLEWLRYTCSIDQLELAFPGSCAGVEAGVETDPSDLNYPSIAIGDLVAAQTVTRRVTNVGDAEQTYTASVEAPPGIDVTVTPEEIAVAAGETASFEVRFEVVDAPVGSYAFGALTWVGDDVSVRSPLAVRPAALAAPDEISGRLVEGTRDFDVLPGFTGALDLDVDGLVPSAVVDLPVTNTPDTILDGLARFSVPTGTTTVRFATFADEVDAADVDLYVYDPTGNPVDLSAGNGSDEHVDIDDPAPGTWFVAVDMVSSEPSVTAPVHGFRLRGTDDGNLTVDPDPAEVTVGDARTLSVAWQGLEPESRYLGAVRYSVGEDTDAGRTLVSVDARTPVVDRLGGADRYATAAEISARYGDGVDTVYIAGGLSFADALSATSAAANGRAPASLPGADGSPAPVLLTRPGALPQPTVEALDRLAPSRIVVLGGTSAVGPAVATALEQWGTVERVSGADRYATSAAMALLYPSGVETVYVASGDDKAFADALSGGALAGHQDAPVVLTRPDRVDPATAAALEHLDPAEVVVVGGTGAVSRSVFDALGAQTRLSGPDRYRTAVAVSEQFPAEGPAAFVASGLNWPDALAGSALAGSRGGPVLLTRPAAISVHTMDELDRLSPQDVTILGGLAAVGQPVEDTLNAAYPAWVG